MITVSGSTGHSYYAFECGSPLSPFSFVEDKIMVCPQTDGAELDF